MAGLPVAGKAATDGEALGLARRVLLHFLGKGWAGPDDGHVSQKDVHKLGKLVYAELADDTANTRDAWVLCNLEDGAVLLVQGLEARELLLCVRAHGAELVHLEELAVTAHTLLRKEDGTLWVIDLDSDGHYEEEPAEANQDRRAEDNVKGPLHKAIDVTTAPQALSRSLCLKVDGSAYRLSLAFQQLQDQPLS